MSGRPVMSDNVLASSVLPTPAGPSMSTGRPMRAARYTTVDTRRLAMYRASRNRCWTSSTDSNMMAPFARTECSAIVSGTSAPRAASAPTGTMPHGRCRPLPPPAALAGARRLLHLARLSGGVVADGRGTCRRALGGADHGGGVGPGRAGRAGARPRARRARPAGDARARILASAALRASPSAAPRLARRSPQGPAARRGARPGGSRDRLCPDRAHVLLVAGGGGRVLRRPDRAHRRGAGLDRPTLLSTVAAGRRGAPRAAARPGAPRGRRRGRRLRRRPVTEKPHGQRRGGRYRAHAADPRLRHAAA